MPSSFLCLDLWELCFLLIFKEENRKHCSLRDHLCSLGTLHCVSKDFAQHNWTLVWNLLVERLGLQDVKHRTPKELIYTIVRPSCSFIADSPFLSNQSMNDRRFISVGMQAHLGLLPTFDILDFFLLLQAYRLKKWRAQELRVWNLIHLYCSQQSTSPCHRLNLLAEWVRNRRFDMKTEGIVHGTDFGILHAGQAMQVLMLDHGRTAVERCIDSYLSNGAEPNCLLQDWANVTVAASMPCSQVWAGVVARLEAKGAHMKWMDFSGPSPNPLLLAFARGDEWLFYKLRTLGCPTTLPAAGFLHDVCAFVPDAHLRRTARMTASLTVLGLHVSSELVRGGRRRRFRIRRA